MPNLFDLNTASGVLGIVLTVVFFVIGYRQTIGARKERASSANKEMIDVLLRRLILEPSFSITADALEHFRTGSSIDEKVRLTDIHPAEAILALLYKKIVSSDYIAPDDRKTVLKKIQRLESSSDVEEEEEKVAVGSPGPSGRSSKRFPTEVSLGLLSALTAAFVGSGGIFVFSNKLPSDQNLIPSVLLGVVSIAATTLVLVLSVLLRERTLFGRQQSFQAITPAAEFEFDFVRRLKAIKADFEIRNQDIDLVVRANGERIAVELRYRIFGPSLAESLVRRVRNALPRHDCNRGYVVAKRFPARLTETVGDDLVKLVSPDEFLSLIAR
jgi:hypothetical protein